jgi:hypothetical protein
MRTLGSHGWKSLSWVSGAVQRVRHEAVQDGLVIERE